MTKDFRFLHETQCMLPPHLLFSLSFKSFLFVVIVVVVVVTEQNPDAN